MTASGHDSEWVCDGAAALRAAAQQPPDLVLLDLGLPDLDGEEVARRLLTGRPGLPVIMLTARAEEADVVSGLHAGAVDYVTKPFRLAELLARVEAQLRATNDRASEIVTAGDVTVDLAAHRGWVATTELRLRPREFDLLVCLVATAGRVVTRQQLMARVWGPGWVGSGKTLDVHVAALRRRLGETDPRTSRIVAVRGLGYRFDPR